MATNMNIDKYLKQDKKTGGWKLRLSYSPPRMKADRTDIGLNTRDLKVARSTAVSIINALHTINARNHFFLGLIRPMDKESLSCTKKKLKSRWLEISDKSGKKKRIKIPLTGQLEFSVIENHTYLTHA